MTNVQVTGQRRSDGDWRRDQASGLAMLVLMAGTFIFVLDFFIVAVSIPATQGDLGAGPDEIQLVVAGYAAALASTLIIGGRLGDLRGHRRMFALGLGLFTLASAICGLAPTTATLIAGRVLQGLGAGLYAPQVLSIISVSFRGTPGRPRGCSQRRSRSATRSGWRSWVPSSTGRLVRAPTSPAPSRRRSSSSRASA